MSDITSKLLNRVKKAGERSREVKQKEEPRPLPVPKKDLSIPKKETTAAPSSSLLAGMVVPPLPVERSRPEIHVPIERPRLENSRPESHVTSSPSVPRPSMTSRSAEVSVLRTGASTPPPSMYLVVDKAPMTATNVPITDLTVPVTATKATSMDSKKIVLQDRVWELLSELCLKMDSVENYPFRLGPTAVGPTVDLSTSFLRSKEYDWFDVDKDGNMVLQPKIPIFPEDFPPGMPEWPLSWWGIVDPAVGERKEKLPQDIKGAKAVKEERAKVVKEERKRSRSLDRISSKRSPSKDRPLKRNSSSRERGNPRARLESPDSFERKSRPAYHHREEDRPPYPDGRRRDNLPPYPDNRRRDERAPHLDDHRRDDRPPYPNGRRGEDRPPFPDNRRRDERPQYPMDRRMEDRPPFLDDRPRDERPPIPIRDRRRDDRPLYPDLPQPLDDQYGRRQSKSPPGRHGRHPEDRRRRDERRDRPRHPENQRGGRPED